MAASHKSRAVFLSDWDGTIILRDSNDALTDTFGMGETERRKLNKKILDGDLSFRDGFAQMLNSVDKPYEACIDWLVKNIEIDPYFRPFAEWCIANGIEVKIVSSGMTPIIRAVAEKHIGDIVKDIEIICNNVKFNKDSPGGWEIDFRDESHFGHDKSRAITPYRSQENPPTLFYSGDGVSDLSAAKYADVLFARRDYDLERYCHREKINAVVFTDFRDIEKVVKDIFSGAKQLSEYKLNTKEANEHAHDPNVERPGK